MRREESGIARHGFCSIVLYVVRMRSRLRCAPSEKFSRTGNGFSLYLFYMVMWKTG